jgi:hypothetical protein
MFKRTAILLLCMLYTVSVYGIAFNVNFCGNEISSVKVGSAASKCPMCKGIAKMKCCKTNHIEVKVKDAHLANANYSLAKVFAFTAIISNYGGFVSFWAKPDFVAEVYHGSNAPPPDHDLILIKNCTFRI